MLSSCFRLPSEAVVPAEAGLASFFGMLVDLLWLPLRVRLTVARSSGGGWGSAEGLEGSSAMVEAPTTMTEATASLTARDFLLGLAMIAGRALWQEKGQDIWGGPAELGVSAERQEYGTGRDIPMGNCSGSSANVEPGNKEEVVDGGSWPEQPRCLHSRERQMARGSQSHRFSELAIGSRRFRGGMGGVEGRPVHPKSQTWCISSSRSRASVASKNWTRWRANPTVVARRWPVPKLALPRAETPGHFRTIEETFKTQDIKMSRFHFQPSSNESRPGT